MGIAQEVYRDNRQENGSYHVRFGLDRWYLHTWRNTRKTTWKMKWQLGLHRVYRGEDILRCFCSALTYSFNTFFPSVQKKVRDPKP